MGHPFKRRGVEEMVGMTEPENAFHRMARQLPVGQMPRT